MGAKRGKEVLDRLLAENDLTYQDIAQWIVHPGGEKVLDTFRDALDLPDGTLSASRAVLYNYGNMSSATVLFVLEEVLRNGTPQPGDLGLMCSFGAGLLEFL